MSAAARGESPRTFARVERGSGTVALLGVVLALLALAAASAVGGVLFAARTQAQTVADLAALAGAGRSVVGLWQDPGAAPCDLAAQVARANATQVKSCFVRGADTYVIALRRVDVGPLHVAVPARARAGPQEQ